MNGRFGRRLMGALALLAMVAGLSARADYIIIQVNLNGEYRPLTSAVGAAGMAGGAGGDGILGGAPGGSPGGPGGSPPGGGPGGFPGGPGGSPPGGGPGGFPGGPGGLPGGAGGKPGMMPGGPGGDGGASGILGAVPQLPPEYVFVVVEINKNDLMVDLTNAVGAPIRRLATSAGSGIAFNFDTGNPVHVALLKDEGGAVMPSVDKRLGRFITGLGTKGRTKQEESLEISMWALQHGMLKRFEEGMNSLQRDAKTAKVPGVAAWNQTAKSLEGTIPNNPMADSLRRRFAESRQQVDGKYCSIISDRPAQAVEDVQKIANQVDDQVRSIYGWFAWHGITMKPLRQKMLIVMGEKVVPRAGESRFHDIMGATNLRGTPYSLQQIVVNDPHLRNIQQRLKQFSLKGWNLAKLLKLEARSYPDVVSATAGLEIAKLCDVAYVSMLNIASEALRNETERADRTFLVATQMLPLLGELPDGVIPPAWLEYGMGATFQTPTATPWTTLGMGHSVYLPLYKELARAKKLESAPADALRKTVCDVYFRESANLPANKALAAKAHATAWSFFYYAARKQPALLSSYLRELGQSPRDIELTEDTLWGCFTRSFLKDRKVDDIAREWDVFIRQEPLEGERMFTLIRAAQEEYGFDRAPDARRNALMSANGLLFSNAAIIQEAIKAGMAGGGAAAGGPGGPAGAPGSTGSPGDAPGGGSR